MLKSMIDIKGETCFRIYNGEFLLSSFKSICLCTTSVQEIFFHTIYTMNHDSQFRFIISVERCVFYLFEKNVSVVSRLFSLVKDFGILILFVDMDPLILNILAFDHYIRCCHLNMLISDKSRPTLSADYLAFESILRVKLVGV